MTDIILVLVIAVIVGGAIVYIRKEKKRGVRCVGCPDGGTCGGNCSGCGGSCGCDDNTDASQKILIEIKEETVQDVFLRTQHKETPYTVSFCVGL